MKYLMKSILSLLLFVFCCKAYGQNLDHTRSVQEINATKFIELMQHGDTSSAFKYFEDLYFSKNGTRLPSFTKLFQTDFQKLPPNTKRYSSLEFPKGINLVKFRYIADSGTVLQVEISYRDGDLKSKITHLSLITTKSLLQQKKSNRVAGYDFD
jgi:hypothetical protein